MARGRNYAFRPYYMYEYYDGWSRQYYNPFPLIVYPTFGFAQPPLPSDFADLLEVALATHAKLPFFPGRSPGRHNNSYFW